MIHDTATHAWVLASRCVGAKMSMRKDRRTGFDMSHCRLSSRFAHQHSKGGQGFLAEYHGMCFPWLETM